MSSPSSGSSTTQARRLFYDIVVTFVLHSSIVLYSTMFLHSDQDPAWHTYRHVDKVVVSFLFRVNVNKIPWHVSEARLHFLLSWTHRYGAWMNGQCRVHRWHSCSTPPPRYLGIFAASTSGTWGHLRPRPFQPTWAMVSLSDVARMHADSLPTCL